MCLSTIGLAHSGPFSLIIDKHAPLCEMRVSEQYCPWIDRDLRDLMRTRDKLKKSAVKSKSALLWDSYRQVRNKVNSLGTQQKKEYYNDKISACKGNMKESWKTINELLNKRSKSSNIDSLKVTLLSAPVSSELPFCKTTLLRKQLISPILFGRSKIGKKDIVLHSLSNRKICKSQCFH